MWTWPCARRAAVELREPSMLLCCRGASMLSRDENQLLTGTAHDTPAGQYFRRYWLPALLSSELPMPDCPPVRLRMMGEDLIAFRDSQGRIGILDEFCPHRLASLF